MQGERATARHESLDHAPTAFAIELFRIDGIEMQPGDPVAAGVIFGRRNEAARDALPPECRIDIEACQPWRKIMRRLELVQHQKTDAGEPAVEVER